MTVPAPVPAWMIVVGAAVALVAGAWHQRVMAGVQPGILAFEFAGSGSRMFDLLAAWGPATRARARRALAIDHLLIVGYVSLLAGLTFVSVDVMRSAGRGAGTLANAGAALGLVAAFLAVVAGLADVVENRALLRCLDRWRDPPDDAGIPASQAMRREVVAALDPLAATARDAARLKFALLAAIALWLVATLTVHLASR
jgi:hypothetical protein